MQWEDDGHCYLCGVNNPEGIKLTFRLEGRVIETEFVAEKRHQGYRNVLHGGFLGMVMDEVMVMLPYRLFGTLVVNAEYGVKLLRPVAVGSRVRVRAAFTGGARPGQRLYRLTAEAVAEDGTPLATGWGTCVRPSTKLGADPEQARRVRAGGGGR